MTQTLILQRLTLPDPAISVDPALYLHGHDPRNLGAGEGTDFTTYVNLFNLGNWAHHCQLAGLRLVLCGTGAVTLRIWHNGKTLLETRDLTLSPQGQSYPIDATLGGVISFDILAKTEASLTAGHFETDIDPQLVPIKLAAVITTFRREEAVGKTIARMTAHLDQTDELAGMHLFVVDNGQSLALPAHPRLTLIPNENLGGSGGFARGLFAAQEAGGFSHVLFMDDDATFAMENLHRTSAFLQIAKHANAAVAGAMISEMRPWAMWENGAIFDRLSLHQHSGVDLRDPEAVIAMENTNPEKPAGFYGGWWYFAFPINDLDYYPFPFFVRGDDVSFSLSNTFKTATLNGVMSLQDDFAEKASPLTLYLDLRYHLHVALVQPHNELGRLGSLKVAMRFIGGSIFRMHYESAAAELQAWTDIQNGPEVFTNDPTMAAKRAQIGALTQNERWKPTTTPAAPTQNAPLSRGSDTLNKLSLNGHLIPAFGWLGKHVTVPITQRGKLWATGWAAQATFLSADKTNTYTLRHNKWTFAKLVARGAWLSLRWIVFYKQIQTAHRASFPKLANKAFWAKAFKG